MPGLRGTDFSADRSTQGRRGRLAPAGVHPHNENAPSADACRQRIQQVSFSYARDALNMHHERFISSYFLLNAFIIARLIRVSAAICLSSG